jgi:hypothetical protein
MSSRACLAPVPAVVSRVLVLLALASWPSNASATTGTTDWRVSTDYASIQAAIAALPATGGVVYIPAGTHLQTLPLVFPTDKPVHLMGAGQGATVLRWQNPARTDSAYIYVRGNNQIVEGMMIWGSNNIAHSSRGVVVDPGNTVLSNFHLRNVQLYQIPSWSIEALTSANGVNCSILSSVDQCLFSNNLKDGLVKLNQGCTTWSFRDNNLGANIGCMLELDRVTAIRIGNTVFESAVQDTPYVKISSCSSISIVESYFENGTANQTAFFVKIVSPFFGASQGITVANCQFTRVNPATTGAKLIQVPSQDVVKSLLVLNPSVYLAIPGPPTANDDIYVGSALSQVTVFGGSVADNGGFRVPRIQDGTSRSLLGNYNQRLRLPRVTTVERLGLTDVKVGDLIYNTTTNQVQVWTGAAWASL